MINLPAHHRWPSHHPAEDRFVEHHPESEWVALVYQRLPGHADMDPSVQFGLTNVRSTFDDHRTGVLVDLEQAGYDLPLVGVDLGGGRLQAHVGPGQYRAVEVPPALLPGLPGNLD